MKSLRDHLVPDVGNWKRWWSMHVMGIGFGFSAVKAGLIAASAGASWFTAFDRAWAWLIVAVLFLVGAVVRVLQQRPRKVDHS